MENKLVIFDLDGVLIDSRETHYKTLNKALCVIDPKYAIGKEEHLAKYDGLPTSKKLDMLAVEKGLPRETFKRVWELKQKYTIESFGDLQKDEYLISLFIELRDTGFKIAVASNSIRDTVKLILLRLGLLEFTNYYVSNEDVRRNKPFPEMYWLCMTALNALPRNTVIIEDSHIGRQGALDSGAHLLEVENRGDLTKEKVQNALTLMVKVPKKNIPWRSGTLNVLIPMAGAGSRFASAGYTFPKPLIEVNGKPMIQCVVENLNMQAHYIFVVQKEHYEKYHMSWLLNNIAPRHSVVFADGLTEGAACTTLLAKEYLDNDNPLVIANSDQILEWNSNEAMYGFSAEGVDGGIVTFEASHPKWSYAKLDMNGFVSEVAEKKVISNNATVGVYYWKKGSDYVKYAEQMIRKNIRTNGEFYVAPVFNEAIEAGAKVRAKKIDKMWGVGTPEDLNYYLQNHKE